MHRLFCFFYWMMGILYWFLGRVVRGITNSALLTVFIIDEYFTWKGFTWKIDQLQVWIGISVLHYYFQAIDDKQVISRENGECSLFVPCIGWLTVYFPDWWYSTIQYLVSYYYLLFVPFVRIILILNWILFEDFTIFQSKSQLPLDKLALNVVWWLYQDEIYTVSKF